MIKIYLLSVLHRRQTDYYHQDPWTREGKVWRQDIKLEQQS